jgi:hypothetical protein
MTGVKCRQSRGLPLVTQSLAELVMSNLLLSGAQVE